ncbi:uncharacterized protein LDX57_010066 [Aspergillus melleus]|uniref:uncharacterized protein n=1 Tax=Aspergillus melleus TaxID=138277 RepID=UPI001E8E7B0F|nr:uncharacterized protein LDX57_010066 [Aspergillus melleus]KAH8432430.1 hypothetical protein LDX57_010066 [Aspergillus melleus]
MLSETFPEHILEDSTRRENLFGDLAKIMLSLNQKPLSHIGSLTFDNRTVHLKNRPLTLRLQALENEGIPTFPRETTYTSVEPYILDLLHCHNNRIRHQPNAIHNVKDGQEQLAALTMMHGLLHRFVSRKYRNGPFVLTLTDLHPSNIFVDDDWHITSLIDLEWACSFPIEMQTPPYWLTGRAIDTMEHGPHLETFDQVITEFMNIYEEQEASLTGSTFQGQIMKECWAKGSFWYFQAIHSPKGLLRVFNEHIQGRFCEEHCTQSIFDRVVSPYWGEDAEHILNKKVKEKAEYESQLKSRFDS